MKRIVIHSNGDQQLLYFPDFFEKSALQDLIETLNWKNNKIKVFGKVYDEPRSTAWYGKPYKYSSIEWPAQELTSLLQDIQKQVEDYAAFSFNSVLANWYRSGKDSMGWHSDNEPEMDQTCIASVTFGQKRKMCFRSKKTKEKIEVELLDRSLLLMLNFQSDWQHSIPKSSKDMKDRVNLTYRRII